MGDYTELPSSSLADMVDIPEFDFGVNYLPDPEAENPFDFEPTLSAGFGPVETKPTVHDTETQGEFDPFGPNDSLPLDPSLVGQSFDGMDFNFSDAPFVNGGQPQHFIQQPQPVYPVPVGLPENENFTVPYGAPGLCLDTSNLSNYDWSGPASFDPYSQNQFADITPVINNTSGACFQVPLQQAPQPRSLPKNVHVPIGSLNPAAEAFAIVPPSPRKHNKNGRTAKQLKAPIKAFMDDMAAAKQAEQERQLDHFGDFNDFDFNAPYDVPNSSPFLPQAPEAFMYPINENTSAPIDPPTNTVSLPPRTNRRPATRSQLTRLRADRLAYPWPSTSSSSTPSNLSFPATPATPSTPGVQVISSTAASNYALYKIQGDQAPKVQARRKGHPGRKIAVVQTPDIIARNERRRERYRASLPEERRKRYDEEHPGMINVLDAETR